MIATATTCRFYNIQWFCMRALTWVKVLKENMTNIASKCVQRRSIRLHPSILNVVLLSGTHMKWHWTEFEYDMDNSVSITGMMV